MTDVCAAAFSELLPNLFQHWGMEGEQHRLQRVCAWIASTDAALFGQLPFPLSVKLVLQQRGVPILPLSRQAVNAFTTEQQQRVDEPMQLFEALHNHLGIASLI